MLRQAFSGLSAASVGFLRKISLEEGQDVSLEKAVILYKSSILNQKIFPE